MSDIRELRSELYVWQAQREQMTVLHASAVSFTFTFALETSRTQRGTFALSWNLSAKCIHLFPNFCVGSVVDLPLVLCLPDIVRHLYSIST